MATIKELDVTGVQCPMPLVQLNRTIQELDPGDELVVTADDPVFHLDIQAWCERTGHLLVELRADGETHTAVIRKRDPSA